MNETMSDTKKLLVEARAFVEKGWAQRHIARDMNWASCLATDERAREWCMAGALFAAAHKFFSIPSPVLTEAEFLVRRALLCDHPKVRSEFLSDFNDAPERKKEEVLATFDKAIEMAKAEGVT